MSVYNGAFTVKDAIESILKQSFKDFEFVIVNDGSTDNTLSIINSFSDSRIKVINQKNKGLTKSLNIGIHNSKAELIARIDADDYCQKDRLELQYKFFKKKNIVLLGTLVYFKINQTLKKSKYLSDAQILETIKTKNPFSHSSVMFKKEEFLKIGGYNEKMKLAQDYDAWLRLSERGNLSMLNKHLVTIRLSSKSISRDKIIQQAYYGFIIRKDKIKMTINILLFIRHIFLGIIPLKLIDIKRTLFDD
jgi:glycosyltransferase involved in cell wall biosynthesis